jgi:hypothetical protein
MKDAKQYPQQMIKPSSAPTLDVEHITHSAPAAGIKVEIADNEEDTESTNPSASYYDNGEDAKNTQMVSDKEDGSDSIDPLKDARTDSVIEYRQADQISTRTYEKQRKPSNQDASAPQKRKKTRRDKYVPTLNHIILTIGASNYFNSKRQLDTVMCLKCIPRINHWEYGYKQMKTGMKPLVSLNQQAIKRN